MAVWLAALVLAAGPGVQAGSADAGERLPAHAAAAGDAGAPARAATDRPAAALTLRAAGDVMLGTEDPPGYLPPGDANDSLTDVKELLRDADLTFVNLEGPLCDEGESSKCKTKRT